VELTPGDPDDAPAGGFEPTVADAVDDEAVVDRVVGRGPTIA